MTEPETPAPEEEKDPFEELRKIADFGDYDERALDDYQALSYYFSLRKEGMPRPTARVQTCAMFGHDAPRGQCLRCGIGVDPNSDEAGAKRERRRMAERDAWLASRW